MFSVGLLFTPSTESNFTFSVLKGLKIENITF